MFLQPLAGRAVGLDIAGRADVIGGDRIAQDQQRLGIDDVLHRFGCHGQAIEIGRIGDIRRTRAPLIGFRSRHVDRLPVLVALVDIGIARPEHRAIQRPCHDVRHFGIGWPDVLQIDIDAIGAGADRGGGEILDHRALQRIGHHQRRAGEEIGAHVGADAAFEIAVARNHRGGDQPVLVDRFADRFGERPRIADARGAAIADEVEADVVEVVLQPGLDQVVGDHLAPRRERGLDPRLGFQPQFVGLFGDEAGRDQHARVRGVGATGDRRDHHVAIADIVRLAFDGHAGLRLLVDFGEVLVEHIIDIGKRDFVLRTLGTGKRGHHGRQIEFERRGKDRLDRRVDPEPLFLGISFDERNLRFFAPGQAQIIERLVIDAEKAARRAIFGRHIGERGAIGQSQPGEARPVIFDEAADHAVLAQQIGRGEHQVGGGHAFFQFAGEAETDHFGDQHRHRLAKHGRLGFDPADAPAEHAQPVDHRGVAVGADARIGIGHRDTVLVGAGPHRLRDVFQIDLVADAGARRHRVEIVEAFRSPFEEVVAFEIALVFNLDVLFERLGRAEFIDHDRVVDDEVDRDQRVDLAGIAAELGNRIAHRGEIDHARHAGEILQQHARGAVLDLAGRFDRVVLPVDQRFHVMRRNGEAAVFEPQQVFQQHFHRKRQPRNVAILRRSLGQRIIRIVLATDGKRAAGAERVLSNLGHGDADSLRVKGFPAASARGARQHLPCGSVRPMRVCKGLVKGDQWQLRAALAPSLRTKPNARKYCDAFAIRPGSAARCRPVTNALKSPAGNPPRSARPRPACAA